MFHSPAWNVTSSPAAASVSGTQVMSVAGILLARPSEPSQSCRNASSGGASTSRSSSTVARSASSTDTTGTRTFCNRSIRRTRSLPPISRPSSSTPDVVASTTSSTRPAKNTAIRSA